MKKIGSIIGLFFILGHSSMLIAGETVPGFATRGWHLQLQGQRENLSAGPDDLDQGFEKLNVNRNTTPGAGLVFELPRFFPNLYVLTTPVEFGDAGEKHVKFKVNRLMKGSGTATVSHITLNEIDLALYYDMPFVKNFTDDTMNIDLGLNVRAIDVDGKIAGQKQGKVLKNVVVPIPMIFGALQFHPFEDLALEAEGRGISIGDNKAFSLVGRIRWNVMDQVFAAGGYRFDKFDVDYQGVLIDADISGPFFEAGLSF